MASAERARLPRLAALAVAAVTVLATTVVTAGPAQAVEVYPRPYDNVITLAGHGYGHGHGMSQWGAQGAAIQGKSWSGITDFYYPGTNRANKGNPALRVLISGVSSFIVQGQPGLTLSYGTGHTNPRALPTSVGGKAVTHWRVLRGPAKAGTPSRALVQYTTAGSGRWTTYATAPAGWVNIRPTSGTLSTFVSGGYRTYRGELRFVLSGSAGFERANTVLALPMESYLRAVVPSEMPASWRPAAVQAQAVAARTYAEYDREHSTGSFYDTCDTTQCQVFGPVSKENALSDAAIKVTAGQVLTYNEKTAFTQFSASNGGWTTTGSQPYLLAKPDPYDGVVTSSSNPHSWTKNITVATVEAAYPQIGSYLRMRILKRDGNGEWGGRVLSLALDGSRSSVTITGATFAAKFGLRHQWFIPTNRQNPTEGTDFDGDGRTDLIARQTSTGDLWLYRGNGKGGWLGRVQLAHGWSGYSELTAPGDFDGDGAPDLLARDGAGALWLYPGNGQGGWFGRRQVGSGWTGYSQLTGAGDFDGDGFPDLFARDRAGTLWLYRGNGHGGWLGRVRYGSGWNAMTALVGRVDFDGRGGLDLLARQGSNGALWLYRGDGKGGWLGRVQVGNGWSGLSGLVAGDFNGDHFPDLLARDTAGALWLYRGNGKGGWLGRVQAGHGWSGFSELTS